MYVLRYHAFLRYIYLYQKQTNKICFFNFGKDLGYFVILRYKLCDFIKIHDDYVNDQMKGDFQKILLLFHIRGRVYIYI